MSRTLNIIGCGKVGRTLGRLWAEGHVVKIQDVLNRSAESAVLAVSFIGEGQAATSVADMRAANFWMIATPDGEIRSECDDLARSGKLGPGAIVFHCSGALDSSELASVRALGAETASVHPVASFAEPESMVAHFAGTCCCIEGDPRARAILGAAFDAIGGRVLQIDGAAKIIYHAGAVFASNYIVTLLETALRACSEAGIPRIAALEFLQPLVEGSVANVFKLGTAKALTGPIARGDLELVKKQYAALAECDPEIAELYKQLGLATARLAGRELEL